MLGFRMHLHAKAGIVQLLVARRSCTRHTVFVPHALRYLSTSFTSCPLHIHAHDHTHSMHEDQRYASPRLLRGDGGGLHKHVRCIHTSSLPLASSSSHTSSLSPVSASNVPVNLRENTVTLMQSHTTVGDVFLVGTSHAWGESGMLVRKVIADVKPGVVMVELCDERAQNLRKIMRGEASSPFDTFVRHYGADMKAAINAGEAQDARLVMGDRQQRETMQRLSKAVEEMGGIQALAVKTIQRIMLNGVIAGTERGADAFVRADQGNSKNNDSENSEQKQRMTEALGRELVPLIQASTTGGASSNYGDTLKDAWERLSHTLKLSDRKSVRVLKEYLDELAPELMHVILEERDEFMFDVLTNRVQQLQKQQTSPSSNSHNSNNNSVAVCVVGMAHMDGIERRWQTKYGSTSIMPVNLGDGWKK